MTIVQLQRKLIRLSKFVDVMVAVFTVTGAAYHCKPTSENNQEKKLASHGQ